MQKVDNLKQLIEDQDRNFTDLVHCPFAQLGFEIFEVLGFYCLSAIGCGGVGKEQNESWVSLHQELRV
ncbi:hypothetical protein K2173_027895 [Erythroxylum novogranatense]|uniref:Uncharacterized protein n=1 Tax=Erythroxylum novogranatense TaxID=1862640 RepID=A0AAV8U2Y0_9ROSI|nr:hypothetical protein K2173_027895 [Erythroxylum novogranatense]